MGDPEFVSYTRSTVLSMKTPDLYLEDDDDTLFVSFLGNILQNISIGIKLVIIAIIVGQCNIICDIINGE